MAYIPGTVRRTAEPSRNERRVLLLIAQGWRGEDIARRMGLKRQSVTEYRLRVMRKLNLRTNAELAVYAREQGLTQWPFTEPPP